MGCKSFFTAGLGGCLLVGAIPVGGALAQDNASLTEIPAEGEQIGNSRFERSVGPTIVNRGSELYTFSSFKLDSEDGKRHYWVQIGIPKRPAPSDGYPVIYMVDGNAAMGLIKESELEAMDILSPPVLVAVGYDTYSRLDTLSRAYDYTPPVVQDGKSIDPVVRGRPGGGAEIFANFIENTIKPRVEALTTIDRNRQTLWGHSYGGLFTLYTLHAHPNYYQRYAAGDPSLWYHDGELVQSILATPKGAVAGRTVRLMSGGGRIASATAQDQAQQSQAQNARRASVATAAAQAAPRQPDTSRGLPRMPDAMQRVLAALSEGGATISYRQFPGLSHGEMMGASLVPALMLAARPQDAD
ncbi:MAG TPA: alpha/beta hydrolase-fold protein [Croceibacterium sp.]|nr:alpha/beta hydrolase-fold protein [Croceibacterium sp.]